MTTSAVALSGAPDTTICTKDEKSSAVQVMQLRLSKDILEGLLQSARSGKAPRILFGRAPRLQYGEMVHALETSTTTLRTELYRSGRSDSENDLSFAGLVNHRLIAQKVQEVTAGTDAALETLKNHMAALSQAKEARRTVVEEGLVHNRNLDKKSHRKLLSSSSLSTPGRSLNSSPARSALASPALPPAPTSAPTTEKATVTTALRKAITYFLAVEPRDFASISRCVAPKHTLSPVGDKDLKDILAKIGKLDTEKRYYLQDRAYKGIDVWGFPYSEGDRSKLIDNSVRAFDRLRLPKDDRLWQALLPQHERGKGKCLSRLNINSTVLPTATTPLPKFSKMDKKSGSTKKAEKKDHEEGKKSPQADGEAVLQKKTPRDKKGGATPAIKVTEKEAKPTAKKISQAGKAGSTKPNQQTPNPSDAKPLDKKTLPGKSTEKKAAKEKVEASKRPQGTKPKTPSPLSAALNASDLEEDHPAHKALAASVSPAKSSQGNSSSYLKRKANDLDDNIHKHSVSVKRTKADPAKAPVLNKPTSTPNSDNIRKPASARDPDTRGIKRTISSDISTLKPAKQRKIDSVSGTPRLVSTPMTRNPSSPVSSDSSTDHPLSFSARQTVELAEIFQKHYEKYKRFHMQLTTNPKPPTDQQREELLKMRRKLEEMKREISDGARGLE